MTIDHEQIEGRPSVQKIIQGASYTIAVQLFNRKTREPKQFTAPTAARAQFANADGTTLTLTLDDDAIELLDGYVGLFSVTLTAAQTTELAEASDASWEFEVEEDGNTTIVQFIQCLEVVPQLF